MNLPQVARLACVALAMLSSGTAILPAAESPQKRAHTCATLDAQYQRLEARMRSGYSARESQRLWERRRELQARLRALRCRDLARAG